MAARAYARACPTDATAVPLAADMEEVMEEQGFRVGHYLIEWRDDDVVQISNTHLGRSAILYGGDFESILSGIIECANLSIRDALS